MALSALRTWTGTGVGVGVGERTRDASGASFLFKEQARRRARERVGDSEGRSLSVGYDLGELASKIVIVTLFSSMAMRLAADAVHTGHVTGILLLASEALVVALTLVRRAA